MSTYRSYTGFLTVDLGTGENVGTGDVLPVTSAPPLTIILSDGDPQVEGDPFGDVSNDPQGDQVAHILDSGGAVLEDGAEFYMEMSFTFTDSAGVAHTGYQFEIEGGSGRDFVILPPGVAAGDITVTAIDFTPSPDQVDYDALASSDEAIDPADFANLNLGGDDILLGGTGDDTVVAGAGDDTIFGSDGDDSIAGEAGGDFIVGDGLDQEAKQRLSFEWNQLPDPNGGGLQDGDSWLTAAGQSISQDTGGMNVTLSFLEENGNTTVDYGLRTVNTTGIDSGGEVVDNNEAGVIFNTGGGGDVARIEFDFAATNPAFSSDVENVSFRINDIDEVTFRDQVGIFAYDAAGNQIPVILNGGADMVLSDTDTQPGADTATAVEGTGNGADVDADKSLLVTIPGPVSRFVIDYDNLDTAQQAISITDVYFDAGPAAAAGDDTLIGGDGDDNILGGEGDDSLVGDGPGSTTPFTYEFYELDGQAPGTLADAGFDAAGNNSSTPDATGNATDLGVGALDAALGGNGDTYAVKYTTTLTVGTGGTYTFDLASDDGSRLYIDGVEIIDNDGLHGVETQSGSAVLTPGEHLVEIIYFENTGGDSLTLDMSGPDTGGGTIAFETANIGVDLPASGDDTLAGGDGADTLAGGLGADAMVGNADQDLFQFEDAFGADTITGGETTTTGTDSDTVDASGVTLTGVELTYTGTEAGTIGDGTDTASFTEIEEVILTDQDDTVDATAVATGVSVDTRDGDDTIVGGAGADTILAGAGDDTVAGGLGADSIVGGTGDDVLDYSASDGAVTVDLATGGTAGGHAAGDVISGMDGIIGSGFDDSLAGYDGTFDDPVSNTLDGGAGDDTLAGGGGADSLVGGADADSVLLDDGFGADTIIGGETGTDADVVDASAVGAAVDVLYSGNEAGTLTDGTDTAGFSEVEGLVLTDQDDTVDASATTSGVSIDGAGGDDTVLGGAGADSVLGGDGADTITGGAGDDTALGGADGDLFNLADGFGTDVIAGGEAVTSGVDTDVIDASGITATGADLTYSANEAGDLTAGGDSAAFTEVEAVILTDQADTVDASATTSGVSVDGAGGDDAMLGGSGADTLTGGDGADTIAGGAGADNLVGGADEDTFTLANGFGADVIAGGETATSGSDADVIDASGITSGGVNVVHSSDEAGTLASGADTLTFSEIEAITLTAQGDTVDAGATSGGVGYDGGAGDDSLTGGAGVDTLAGGAGADTIRSGAGADLVDGGADADLVQLVDGGGADTVVGGEAGSDADTLDASQLSTGATVVYSGDEAGTLNDGTSDIAFSQIEAVVLTDQDDALDGTASSAPITADGGAGADTLQGGSGADSLTGGADGDTFTLADGFGGDVLAGGEAVTTGTDFDLVDASAVTTPGGVTVTYSGDEAGTLTDGAESLSFSQVEGFILTGNDDVVDAAASSLGVVALGGAGDDSFISGSGSDLFNGGADMDSFALNDGFGADTFVGGETGADTDTVDASALTSGVSVTYSGDEAGTLGAGGNALTFSEVEDLVLTGFDDVIDATAATGGLDLDLGAGDDSFEGGIGADVIDGGTGADTLEGGGGDDTLTGGGGPDTFGLVDEDGASTVITDFDTATNTTPGTLYDPLSPPDQSDNDFIDLSSYFGGINELRAANLSPPGADVVLDLGGGQTLTLQGVTDVNTLNWEMTNVICFARGTAIRTPSGERLIEALKAGDWVSTVDNGARRIRWIGARTLGAAELTALPHLRPIHIGAGALGNTRDLTVSPQHRMLMAGAMVDMVFGEAEMFAPAKALLGMSGVSAGGVRPVTYMHMLFDEHEVVWANGAMAESLHPGDEAFRSLDQAGRAEVLQIFPELSREGPKRAIARQALTAREARRLVEVG